MKTDTELPLPGARLAAEKMPSHWLLAPLGKRVLRPGGGSEWEWRQARLTKR